MDSWTPHHSRTGYCGERTSPADLNWSNHTEWLKSGCAGELHEWWSPMLHDPDRLHSSEYRAYAILTMCRMLHTLQYGTVVSKPVAARWAQEILGKQWEALIKKALAWQHQAKFNNMNETLDFIRYTLERSRQIKTPNWCSMNSSKLYFAICFRKPYNISLSSYYKLAKIINFSKKRETWRIL